MSCIAENPKAVPRRQRVDANPRVAVMSVAAAFRHIALKKTRPDILISKYKNFLTGLVRLLELVFMHWLGHNI